MLFAFARYPFPLRTSIYHADSISRDGGLPFSRYFAHVHKRLNVPLNALMLTSALDIIFGLIYLGSSRYSRLADYLSPHSPTTNNNSAFNAIISAAVVALSVSYAMPIAVRCLRGRNVLPQRYWTIPNSLGWIADIVCPPTLPMNQ